MLPVSRRRFRRLKIAVPVTICLFLLHYLWNLSSSNSRRRSTKNADTYTETASSATNLPCNRLPNSEDVVVVLKTGATEALDRVPIHFRTTFRCVPDYLIFSDFEEEIEGHPVYDCLRGVDDHIKQNHPDFELYNRLRARGRHSLEPDELRGWTTGSDSNLGNVWNHGWRLDKWKFLPLVDEVLQKRPDAKWFFFMEADTYLIWSNLLEWIKRLDHNKPYYIGGQMQIGPVIFAHGGAGFLVSNPALKILSDYRASRLKQLDRFTSDHWAGDCVLGKVMQDAGVPLTWAWPSVQNERLSVFDHKANVYGRRVWCYPVVTYHHMTAEAVESMWQFEQNWIDDTSYPIRHEDVFRNYLLPKFADERDMWDNMSDGERQVGYASESFEDCRAACWANSDCMQFSYAHDECKTGTTVKLGQKAEPGQRRIRSGWMVDRIHEMVRNIEPCGDAENWILQ